MTIKLMLSRLLIRLLGTLKTVCANTTDAEAPFIDLHLSIANGFVSSTIYGKRDDFDIVNFSFLDGDVPRRASYGVYISQIIWLVRVCNRVADFNARNICKCLQG